MRIRFLAALLIAAAAPSASAIAQSGNWVKPPDKLPHVGRGDKTRNLDFLFGALKVAPDDVTAKAIEERIWAVWTVSRSDTANLLMTRVKTAIEAKDLELAIKLLDSIVKVKSDYVEAWNRRATIYYMKKDYGLGFRLHSPIATPLRIELAKSNEGLALVFSSQASF